MATITYGKGKSLQPTSSKALKAVLDENAQSGRVEMPGARKKESDRPAALGFVRVVTSPIKVRYFKNMLAVNSGSVATKLRVKHASYSVEKDSATGENEEVRVTIHALDLAQFFSSKKSKISSY